MNNGRAANAPAGLKFFDTDMVVSAPAAKQFFDKGYRAAARYIPRVTAHQNDITAKEIDVLFNAGLALLPTQHVEPGEWTPTDDKGRQYGQIAVQHCQSVGVPQGVNVVLDLESVALSTPKEQVIRYCNFWHDQVKQAGYLPAIYLGWQVILSPEEAYNRLKFGCYWGAYNVDIVPKPRGFCMHQHEARAGDTVPGYEIDTDLVMQDSLGGLPVFYAPEEWSV